MTIKTRLLTSAAALTFLPVSTLPALAQDGAVMLDPLLLYSLRDVATDTATSETTLDQDELDMRQASTLAEAIGTIPGVTLTNAATPQGSAINIRGLGSDAGVYGGNTKVNVVVDGVAKGQEEIYRQGSLLSIEPELFKQVRVIRGPGESFRWSSGAIGGTIEATTKDAADFLEDGDTFAFRGKLAYQSNANERTATGILAWSPDGKLDVIAFAGYRAADDYTDGAGDEQDDTAYEMPSYLAKVKYRFSDEFSLAAAYSRSQNRLSDVSYDLMGSSFPARIDADVIDVTAWAEARYTPAGNDWIDLTAKFTYSDELIENFSDTTSSTIYNADNQTIRKSFLLENMARFQTGAISHNLLAGIEIGERERSSLTHTGDNAGATPGGTDNFTAIYITNEMEFGNWTVTPQLRYEWQTLKGSDNGLTTDGDEYKAEDWSGALALRYAFSDEFAAFGTLAYNTNLPILDDLTSSTKIETTEKATTLELGVSYDGVDMFTTGDSLSLKAVVFETDIWDNTTYTNYAVYSDPTADTENIQISGFELEANYVHPAFYLDFNAARIRGKWGDGTWFNNAPADMVQLTLGKRFLDDQLDLSVEVKHAWETDRNLQFTGLANTSQAHTTYDFNGAYTPESGALEGMEVRFGIDNLTDEEYTPYLSSRPRPGRTFKLSLAKTF